MKNSVSFSALQPILQSDNAVCAASSQEVHHRKQSCASGSHKRSSSAPLLRRLSSDILDIRGKCYDQNKTFNILDHLREQSIPRRVERLVSETSKNVKTNDITDERKFSLSRTVSLMNNVTRGKNGLLNKRLLEKRRGLHLNRSTNKAEARARMGYTFYRVWLVSRVQRVMTSSSIDRLPVTSVQALWNRTRHTSDSQEVLFSKSYFQKKASIYANVPKWAKQILRKQPIERTARDIMQIHAMMQGLAAYDKFTRRIQLAMCRAMKYVKIEYPRIILRKGHVGLGFYIIFSGSVFINIEELHEDTNKVVHKTVSTLQVGDAFGEVALLRNIRRTASVTVKEDVEVMVIDKNVFARVCSDMCEKEMAEKIAFCRQLPLFKQWNDDAIKHICQYSQIHEYKLDKIVTKNKEEEEEWIYICVEGQCRVINKLQLDKVRSRRSVSFVSRSLQDEKWSTVCNSWFVSGDDETCRRFYPGDLEMMNELQLSLEQTDLRKIARNQVLDNEETIKKRNSRYQKESTTSNKMSEAEAILSSIGKEYNYLPHCTGEAKYCVVNKEQIELLKKKRDERDDHDLIKGGDQRKKSIDVTTLLREELLAGRLNTKVFYLNIATMKRGDVYNLREVLEPTGRQLILVSSVAKILQIKKHDFFQTATKKSLLTARTLALENNYPDDEVLYHHFYKKCSWDVVKTHVLHQTVTDINVTHVPRCNEESGARFTAKERSKSAQKVARQLKANKIRRRSCTKL